MNTKFYANEEISLLMKKDIMYSVALNSLIYTSEIINYTFSYKVCRYRMAFRLAL